MPNTMLKPHYYLAVLLFVVTAFLLSVVPIKAKSALGSSGFSAGVELKKVDSKALTLLEKSLSYRLAVLENSDVPEGIPPKNTGPHGTTVEQEVSGIKNIGDPNAGQVNTSRVQPVNGRNPINSQKYAGTTIPLNDLAPEIAAKYPKSVHFSGAGYPDFTPYATKKVKVNLTGVRDKDFKLANQAAGYKRTPDNYTWHHHQESGLMQLIPSDLHDAVRHTGGVATSGIKPYK